MTPFWILGAALLVLASLALIVPLWRGEGRQSISRSALNKQLYRQRLLEIGEEREQGILAEEPESLVELQRSLLDDIPDVEQTARGGKSLIWIPGVLVLAVVSIGLYAKLGAWQEVSRWQDASSRLGELSNRILVERDAQVTEQDLLDFTLGLRTRLKEEPNDYRGWLLLGRLTLDGNDPEMAREALERAYSLAPQKAMVAVPYAQALMMTGEEARADQLLQAAIAQDPANIEARSVHAFMALQKEDFQTALARWQAMLPLMEKGTPRYVMVERSMEYARAQLKQRGYCVYYLSNIPEDVLDLLMHRDFEGLFDGGVASCEVKINKPDPRIYQALLDKYGLKASECVFIDDNLANVQAAFTLGFVGIRMKESVGTLIRSLATCNVALR